MQERDQLLSTLPPDVRGDAERLYDEAGQTLHDDPDPRDIVAELHRRGLLDTGQLRDAVLALESSLRIRRVSRQPPDEESDGPTILGVLGAGAMGEVLIAKDPGLGRVYAVKRLHPEAAKRRSLIRRFYVEAQVTAQLDHPSIVPIHALIQEADGSLAYAMKLVRGRTLEDYIEETRAQSSGGTPDPEHVLSARLERFLHICDAIAYAHERGVLHRDLKPENVMVGAFGEVIVMDWGIAKILARPDEDQPDSDDEAGPIQPRGETGATKVGTVMGTPRYMSPEQAHGRNDILDARSDQYALGTILYELVSLRPAIRPDLGLDEALTWARTARKQPLKHHAGRGIPRELSGIIDKATQKDPERRYRSVAELAEDVRRYLRDESVKARPDGMLQAIQRWVGRHRQATLALVLSLLLLLVVSVFTVTLVGIGAFEWRRQAVAVREARLTRILSLTTNRAQDLDQDLRRIQGLVTALAYTGERALEGPSPRLGHDPRDAPPGQRASSVYGGRVSVDWPELAAPASARPSADELARIGSLGPQLARALAESRRGGGKVKDRFKLIGQKGTPARWAHLVTQSGLIATLPGSEAFDGRSSDPRKTPWYEDGSDAQGATWTGPWVDPRGQGLIFTCSQSVSSVGGSAGIAALDVTVAHVLKVMEMPAEKAETYLVDPQGRVVVHRGMDTDAKEYEPIPFPNAAIWKAISDTPRSGFIETPSGTLGIWARLHALPMVFAVVAPGSILDAGRDGR